MKDKTLIYQLQNLERYYISKVETVKAVNGISLSIYKREFLAIIGPSGSGKTTFLNLLAGLDLPTKGDIIFNGDRNFSQLTDSQLCDIRNSDIGIIFQFYNMHPSFTAQENIEYPMLIANIPISKREQRAMELIEKVNLLDKKDNFPDELSGGEKQRIGIARALANNPRVIIADEPTGDLDSENAEEIIELLLEINKQGTTIVMVTHDEELITENMRVLNLVDGRILEQKT